MTSKTSLVIALALISVAGLTLGRTCLASGLTDHQYLIQSSQGDKVQRSSTARADTAGATKLSVDLEFADLKIVTDSSSEFKADIVKEVNKPVEADEQKWLDQDWLKVKREGDTLVVYEDKSLKPDLKNHSKKNRNLNLKVTLHVPAGLDTSVDVMAGKVSLDGNYRSVKGHLDAGEVNTTHFSSDQSLELKVSAGQIRANLERVPSRESDIELNVGELNLDVSGNATLDASVSIGSIDVGKNSTGKSKGFGSHKEIRVGSGGTKFRLNVDAGNIKVAQGTVEKSVDSKEDDHDIDLDQDLEKKIDLKFDKDFNIHIDKDLGKDIEAEIRAALKDVDKDVDQALKEAEQEIKRSQKDLKIDLDFDKDMDKDMVPHVREIAQNAMRIAREALAMAHDSVQKALKKSLKEKKGHEPN